MKLLNKIETRLANTNNNVTAYHLWLDLRKNSGDGSGKVCIPANKKRVVKEGCGWFWEIDEKNKRLFLRSPKRVLEAMEKEAKTAKLDTNPKPYKDM